LTPFYL